MLTLTQEWNGYYRILIYEKTKEDSEYIEMKKELK